MRNASPLPRGRAALLALALLLATASGQPAARYDADVVHARDLFNQGLVHFNGRNYEAAIERFTRSLGERGRDNLVRYYLGLAYFQGGYVRSALEQWENIVRLGGQDAVLAQKIASAYALLGRRESVAAFEDYVPLKLMPDPVKTNKPWDLFLTGLQVDRGDQVWFVDHRRGAFGYIHPNGDQVRFMIDGWQKRVPGIPSLEKPYEIIPRDDTSFWVSDFGADRVSAVDREGKILFSFGSHGSGSNGQFLGPSGLAPGPAGQLLVSDTGNCRIQVFNQRGEWLYAFGSRGSGPGELLLPSGLASDPKTQKLYVADRGNNRIVPFSFDGTPDAPFGESFLLKPRKILSSLLPKNLLVVADARNVYLYNMKDDLYRSIFYSIGDTQPRDVEPLAIAFDRSGLLYVGDAHTGGIEVFSPTKLLYVNLNVLAGNVYLRNFPKVLVSVSVRTRDNTPVTGLTRANFELRENGVPKTLAINRLPDDFENLRLAVLVEKSRPAQERQLVLKAMLEDLYSVLTPADQTRLLEFGGGSEDGKGTFREVMAMNNQVLKNIDEVLKSPWKERVYPGTAIRRAIAEQLSLYHKRGLVVLAFSDVKKNQFLPEAFESLASFAAHNGVPVTVVYAGPNPGAKPAPRAAGRKDRVTEPAEEPLLWWKELARRSGGMFLLYDNKSTLENAVRHHRQYQAGVYPLIYESFPNTLKTGLFRTIEVRVQYKGLSGLDNRCGYPIP